MTPYQPKPLQWFLDRIGMRIYRNDNDCPCVHCKNTVENGLIITDRDHAEMLESYDVEYAIEGVFLNYRDEK